MDDFWDDRLASAIFEKIQGAPLKSQWFRDLLEQLLKHKSDQAEAFAKSLLSSIPTEDEARERSVVAACLLLRYAKDAGWSAVWPAFQQDNEFGKTVIKRFIAQDRWFDAALFIAPKLTVIQLSSFYTWLAGQFPHDKYQKIKGGGWITDEDSLASFRDSMLRHLQERGTKQAIDELQKIAVQFPEVDLSWEIIEARKLYRQNTWQPPKPTQVFELARKGHTRWIQDGSQLLDVIVEILEKLNREFQGKDGTTPAAIDLWNQEPYKPRDENEISNYIERYLKRELRGKGVFLGREVQTRRGNLTDVFVETFVPLLKDGFGDRITIVIEVKGCWHRKLKTAMKTQLVDRYLVPSGYQHGLYLVGWFLCDKWDKSDYRQGKTPKWSFEETDAYFVNQAKELSKSGLDVRPFVLDARLS